jgi:hypothetical protein
MRRLTKAIVLRELDPPRLCDGRESARCCDCLSDQERILTVPAVAQTAVCAMVALGAYRSTLSYKAGPISHTPHASRRRLTLRVESKVSTLSVPEKLELSTLAEVTNPSSRATPRGLRT